MKSNWNKIAALVLLALGLLAVLSGCSGASDGAKEVSEVPTVLNQAEYIFAQNFFLNGYAQDYVGKAAEKEGVYAEVLDEEGKVRHYLWGYLDNTKCCDWAWEFMPVEGTELPPVGSQIKIKGKYVANTTALDGYWIDGASVETVAKYTGETADLNMMTMCDMLERVQLSRVMRFPETYEGKSFFAYGRVASDTTIQDPYYDGSWVANIATEDTLPAIGTTIVLKGTVRGGVLAESKIVKTLQ